jgi:hypothetical protein
MKRLWLRAQRDERGTSLILAIVFMVVVGGISSAVLATTTSGVQDRVTLDQARNREYAADAAIEQTIVNARTGSGVCPMPPATPFNLNGVNIHVDCTAAPTVVIGPAGGLLSRNDVSFVACVATGAGYGQACASPATPPIINAQVHFQGTAPTVTTFVQAWSVNG